MLSNHLFHPGEQIKTEAGSKVKAHKTGIYKKWKERSHNKISSNGSDDRAEGTSRNEGKSFHQNLLFDLHFQLAGVIFPRELL